MPRSISEIINIMAPRRRRRMGAIAGLPWAEWRGSVAQSMSVFCWFRCLFVFLVICTFLFVAVPPTSAA